jgi:general secretion pathway protein F
MKILSSTVQFKVRYQINNKIKKDVFVIDDFPLNVISFKPVKYIEYIQKRKVKKGLKDFFSQLNIILQSHITIVDALDILSDSYKKSIFQDIIYDIKISINNGQSIKNNLSKYQNILGELPIAMLSIGQDKGNLKGVIEALYNILDTIDKNKNKISKAMRYPMFLLTTTVVAIYVILYSIVPRLQHIFDKYEDNLPLATKVLLDTKDFIDSNFFTIVISVSILVFYMLLRYRYSAVFRYKMDKISSRYIPFFNKTIISLVLYRFFLVLAQTIQDKNSFQNSFFNSLIVVDNLYVKRVLINIYNDIQNGSNIYQSFIDSKMFDNLTLSLINTGVHTNRFDIITNQITNIYYENLSKHIDNIKNRLAPMIIIVVGGVILWLFLAIFLPIWGLNRVL